jgi:hypothetical protein
MGFLSPLADPYLSSAASLTDTSAKYSKKNRETHLFKVSINSLHYSGLLALADVQAKKALSIQLLGNICAELFFEQ